MMLRPLPALLGCWFAPWGASALLAGSGGGPAPTALAALRSFEASEIVMDRYVGEIGVLEITDWAYSGEGVDPFSAAQPRRTKEKAAKVRLFRGSLDDATRRALGEDVRVLLREYGSTAMAAQELANFERVRGDPRVVELLGSLDDEVFGGASFEDERFAEVWRANLGVDPPSKGSRWLVYAWAGLATAQSLVQPSDEFRRRHLDPKQTGFFGGGGTNLDGRERRRFVCNVMRGALESLEGLHARGVAHRSLGCASIVLDSSLHDKTTIYEISTLRVKLSNFAYSTPSTLGLVAEDLAALGYVFLTLLASPAFECVVDVPKAPPRVDEETLQRLFTEVLGSNVRELEDFLRAEPGWRYACDFLDANDGAGWDGLGAMLNAPNQDFAETNPLNLLTCTKLLQSPTFSGLV